MTRELATLDVAAALRHLEVTREAPSLDYLQRLQLAYKHHVPWESASRIVRRAVTPEPAERPRRPAEFWQRAIVDGTGGTCFESDYAFGTLLRALGFDAEFRINDMPRSDSVACHAAVVVTLDGERYIADVGLGLPIEVPLPINYDSERVVAGATERYRLRPQAERRLDISREGSRDEGEQGPMYLLVDEDVSDEQYDAKVADDYGDDGIFLDAVRMTRWRADGGALRYSPEKALIERVDREWRPREWTRDDHLGELAELFSMPYAVLERASPRSARRPERR